MRRPSSAEEFQLDALTRYVLNVDTTFHWIEDSDRFWFRRETRNGNDIVVVDANTAGQTVVSQPLTDSDGPLRHDYVLSPSAEYAVLRQGDNLLLRVLKADEERCITSDGEPHFGYGDIDPSYDRQSVVRRRTQQLAPLRGVLWSPDSRFIVALRQDLRPFPERVFAIEYAPPGEAYAHPHLRRLPLASDTAQPDSHLVVFDTQTSTLRTLFLNPQALNDLALHCYLEGVVWWNAQDQTLFLITANRGGTYYALIAVDLATGRTREILHETARFNVRLNPFDYARPNVHVMASGAEAIWYSERSGYGHLYLYDAVTGVLKHPITQGDWVVFDLLRIDEVQRFAYFTAATRETNGNPYYRYLYRASLDGGEPQLLTPEHADHKFSTLFFLGAFRFQNDGADRPQPGSSFSPSGRYFIDSFSTVNSPPSYVLRRSSGELVAEFLSSDASALYASGWKPPEQVSAKAADAVTDLYGVITYPRDFDPTRKYPVIDSMYPGPQGSFAPRSFVDQLAGGPIHHLQTLADAGFIVVALDGRGTAHRARAFRDAFLDKEDVFGAADHVVALQNLAAHRPYMDLKRVGIRGQSFGGYGSLRAMLLYPDFFKVGVSATGPGGYLDMESQTNIERFFGVPGACAEARAHYELISNTRLASRLQGRVLLIYGGIDESVPIKQAFTVFDAFIRADKDIDMLLVPNSPHSVSKEPYVIRRSVEYFVEHLTKVDSDVGQ